MKRIIMMLACMLMAGVALAGGHWVGTWGTAPQLVERHNNPPAPGLTNNSLREIVKVSIGGKKVRLKLTNEFSTEATEIKAVELAIAKTAGSSSEIDEASTVSLTFDGQSSVTIPAGGKVVSDGEETPIPANRPAKPDFAFLRTGRVKVVDATGAVRCEIAFAAPTEVLVQDGRAWGIDGFSLRVRTAHGEPYLAGTPYKVALDYTAPEPFALGRPAPLKLEAGPDWIPM